MTIRHLDDLAVGAVMFALCIGAGMWLSREEGYAPLIVFGVIGLIFLLFFIYTGTKTETISEEGICAKSILKTRWIPWQQVNKVGIAHLNLGGWPQYYLSITFDSGKAKKGFLLRNCEQLRSTVTKFYGPLDFDQTAKTGE